VLTFGPGQASQVFTVPIDKVQADAIKPELLDQALGHGFDHFIQAQRAENRVGNFMEGAHVRHLVALGSRHLQAMHGGGQLMGEIIQKRNVFFRERTLMAHVFHPQDAENVAERPERDVGDAVGIVQNQEITLAGDQTAQSRTRQKHDLLFPGQDIRAVHQLPGHQGLPRLVVQEDRRAVDLHRFAEVPKGMGKKIVFLARQRRQAAGEPLGFVQSKFLKLVANFL